MLGLVLALVLLAAFAGLVLLPGFASDS